MDYKAAVITVSDRCSTGEKVDKSGPAVAQMLEEAGFPVIYRGLVPDERHEISAPEATRDVISREIPAIPQAMLHYSLGLTPRAMLTRGVAGIRGKSLILNLPGNEGGAKQNLSAVLGVLEHALQMISKDE